MPVVSVLAELTRALSSGSVEVIDLTAPLSNTTPLLELPPEFGQTARFELEEISRYDGPHGHRLDTVEFPPTDIAAIARGFGFEAITVRAPGDLAPVAGWVAGDRSAPLLIDAKTTRSAAWFLEDAFAGH
jgi:hypothetical protein